MVSGYPTSTNIPRVDGLSTGPREMGRHNLSHKTRHFPPLSSFFLAPDKLFPRLFISRPQLLPLSLSTLFFFFLPPLPPTTPIPFLFLYFTYIDMAYHLTDFDQSISLVPTKEADTTPFKTLTLVSSTINVSLVFVFVSSILQIYNKGKP